MHLVFSAIMVNLQTFSCSPLIWCQLQAGNFFFFNENRFWWNARPEVFRKNKISQDLSQKHVAGNNNILLMHSSLLFTGVLTSLQTYCCSPVKKNKKNTINTKGSAIITTNTCYFASQEQNESGTKPSSSSGRNQNRTQLKSQKPQWFTQNEILVLNLNLYVLKLKVRLYYTPHFHVIGHKGGRIFHRGNLPP